MRCPQDKTQMKEIYVYKTTMDFCPVCFGVWFDSGELKILVDKMMLGIKDQNLPKNKKIPENEKKHHWEEDFVDCPRDYIKMYKNDFGGNKKIHLDRCAKCEGVWVDGYEIERIEKDIMPNRYLDVLAKAIVMSSVENEKEKQKITLWFFRMYIGLVSFFVGNLHIFYRILQTVIVYIIKKEEKKLYQE